MNELRCKVCGGVLVQIAEGIYECESCGNRVIRPAGNDRAALEGLMKGAGQLLEAGDFDSAYAAYETILAKDPSDVRARWQLLLCRYGVRYEEDALTGRQVPTVNRMRYDPLLEDPDYQRVLADAGSEKDSYGEKARAIADIQARYLEIARREQPYDVFISFKAEDGGVRTRDSVIAQEIYDRLTERGIRTFYSRITLQGKSGAEYEPYIFSALHSARLMLLVATSREHVRAAWVQNEWRRYLALMAQDRDRSLLPVYEGMEKEDFPSGIPVREAVDYSRDGALAEIVQGVLTLTGLGTVLNAEDTRGTILRLTDSLRSQIEHEQWKEARDTAGKILDLDAENGDAYFYLLLAEYRVTRPTKLADLDDPWTESRYYQRAMKYAAPARRQMLEAVKLRRDMRTAASREQMAAEAENQRLAREKDVSYEKALAFMKEGKYSEALALLSGPAYAHPEAHEKIVYCQMALKEQQEVHSDFFTKQLEKMQPGILQKAETAARRLQTATPAGGGKEAFDRADSAMLLFINAGVIAALALLGTFRILPYVFGMVLLLPAGLFPLLLIHFAGDTKKWLTLLRTGAFFGICYLIALVMQVDNSVLNEDSDPRRFFPVFLVYAIYIVALGILDKLRYSRYTAVKDRAVKIFRQIGELEDKAWNRYTDDYSGYLPRRPVSAADLLLSKFPDSVRRDILGR